MQIKGEVAGAIAVADGIEVLLEQGARRGEIGHLVGEERGGEQEGEGEEQLAHAEILAGTAGSVGWQSLGKQ